MTKILKIVIAVLIFSSCSFQNSINEDSEIEVINSCFTNIIDTVTYEYRTLLPYGDKLPVTKKDTFIIAVYKDLIPATAWNTQVLKILSYPENSTFKGYADIINQTKGEIVPQKIDFHKLTNTGRFKLIEYSTIKKRIKEGVIGNVIFSRVSFDESKTKAIIIVTIKDAIKSERTDLVFVEKLFDKWTIVKKITMEVS